jgi:hypothetical protein
MTTLLQGSFWRTLCLTIGVLAAFLSCYATSSRALDGSQLDPSSASELGNMLGCEVPADCQQADDIWGPSSCAESTACYQMNFSIGPWTFGGPDLNFGFQTPDGGVTVTNGITYTNDADGYILDAALIVPLARPGMDIFIVGVEYWDATNTGWTSRATTPGDNYFASLPIVPDPANGRLGSVFNGVSGAAMRMSTSNVSIDILGAKLFRTASITNTQCVDWQLQAGVTMGVFLNTTDISIIGNERGNELTETGRYELESFRVGPMLGIVRTTDLCLPRLGIAGRLDMDLAGRLNIGSDHLYGIQRQNGPTTVSLGTDRTLQASVRETTFSPELITGMTLWVPLHNRLTWSIGWDFHVMFGTPAVSFPNTSAAAANLEPTTDFTIANETYYGGSVKFGVQY